MMKRSILISNARLIIESGNVICFFNDEIGFIQLNLVKSGKRAKGKTFCSRYFWSVKNFPSFCCAKNKCNYN